MNLDDFGRLGISPADWGGFTSRWNMGDEQRQGHFVGSSGGPRNRRTGDRIENDSCSLGISPAESGGHRPRRVVEGRMKVLSPVFDKAAYFPMGGRFTARTPPRDSLEIRRARRIQEGRTYFPPPLFASCPFITVAA